MTELDDAMTESQMLQELSNLISEGPPTSREELCREGWFSCVDMAANVGQHQDTVRRKLRKLVQDGVVCSKRFLLRSLDSDNGASNWTRYYRKIEQ